MDPTVDPRISFFFKINILFEFHIILIILTPINMDPQVGSKWIQLWILEFAQYIYIYIFMYISILLLILILF
jgi:hypothetical protein